MSKDKNKTVEDLLSAAMTTFAERGEQYGKSYLEHGKVMQALFPNGMVLSSVDDWNRFGVLNMIVSKLVRLTNAYRRSEVHTDSIHDLGVYAFILEEIDCAKGDKNE